MLFPFILCPQCQARYAGLQLNPQAQCAMCIMPLCSLVWDDEHPDANFVSDFEGTHGACRASIIRLANARTKLWKTGAIPADCRELWNEARQTLPGWPGFQRLHLNQDQQQSLRMCAEEFDDMMGAIREDFPNVTTTDHGGGYSSFVASRGEEPEHATTDNDGGSSGRGNHGGASGI